MILPLVIRPLARPHGIVCHAQERYGLVNYRALALWGFDSGIVDLLRAGFLTNVTSPPRAVIRRVYDARKSQKSVGSVVVRSAIGERTLR